MRPPHLRACLGFGSLLIAAAIYACGGGDDSASPGGDAGGGGDDSSAGADASFSDSGGLDSGGADGSSGGDSGTDGATSGTTACGASFRVDVDAGNTGYSVAAVADGDKYLVHWIFAHQFSGDGNDHIFSREFNGTSFGPVQDLGATVYTTVLKLEGDDGHQAYAQWLGSTGEQYVYDFASDSYDTPSTFNYSTAGEATSLMSALMSTGLGAHQPAAGGLVTEKYDSTGSDWIDAGYSLSGLNYGVRIARRRGTNHLALLSYSLSGADHVLQVAAFDGATWTTSTKTFTHVGGMADPTNFELAVYANGDPLIAYDDARGSLNAMRFVVSTATFATPELLGTYTTGTELASHPQVVVDSNDHPTVTWSISNLASTSHAYGRRNLGAGWGSTQDLGVSETTAVAADALGHVYELGWEPVDASSHHVVLRRADPASDSFGAPADTGLPVLGNQGDVDKQVKIVFDSAGHPIVLALNATGTSGGIQVVGVKCN